MSKVYSLHECSYSVDASKVFKPFDPSVDDAKDRPASVFVHVSPYLLQYNNELVLFDTGLGYINQDGILGIHSRIKAIGFEPEDVTKVLMSHLHFDHAGGMVYKQDDRWEISFPHADYFVQRDELDAALTKESKSYRSEPLEVLRRYGGLQLMEGDGFIDSNIQYELTGAHSEFHQVFKVRTEEAMYFYGGDVVPEAAQVIRRFIAKYDFDGRKSMELRQQYGNQAAKEDWICLMYHDKRNGIVRFGVDAQGALFIQK